MERGNSWSAGTCGDSRAKRSALSAISITIRTKIYARPQRMRAVATV